MVLTVKNRCTWRRTCPKAVLFLPTNFTSIGLGSNPTLRGDNSY